MFLFVLRTSSLKVPHCDQETASLLSKQNSLTYVVFFAVLNVLTGAGKSTLVNYLIGVELKLVLNNGLETFVVNGEHGIAGIKNGAISATLLPGVHATDDGVLTDCPGLFDTRAPAVNVANGINVAACAEAACEAKIVLLIEFGSVNAARGNGLKENFLALADSLGGVKGLKKHADSVLLLVSKAPLDFDAVNARELLTTAAAVFNEEERAVALELFGRAELYHPLDLGHESWIKLDYLKEKIKGLTSIPRPGQIYRSPLSFADEKLLRDITNEQVEAVKRGLIEPNFRACSEALADLERLNVVNLRIVHVLVAEAMSQVRGQVERFFSEAQHYLFNDCFDEASKLATQLRMLGTELRRNSSIVSSTLAADLARSLNLRVGELETLIEHRRLEEQRFEQAQLEHKAQSKHTALLQAKLDKLEVVNRGLASELESVQNELLQAQQEAKNKARHLEATFLEKIKALDDSAARGEKKEESIAEAAALREEMNVALKALHEDAAAKEEAIKRSIEEQKALAKSTAAEEDTLRRDLESAEGARRRQSLDVRQVAAAAAAVEAAERRAADLADEAQKAMESAQKSTADATAAPQAVSAEGDESPSSVQAEGEARVEGLQARHDANLEALRKAAEAQTSTREAQLTQTLVPLERARQKAKDDFDPDAAELFRAQKVEAQTAAAAADAAASQRLFEACESAAAQHSKAVENIKLVYETRSKILEELQAAKAALAAAESENMNTTKATKEAVNAATQARAAALEAAAEKKMAEGRQAMSADNYAKAKALKVEAGDLKQRAVVAAGGEDDAGIEERSKMVQAVDALEAAVLAAKAKVGRLEDEVAVLPKTTLALEELHPHFEKRSTMRREAVELWSAGHYLAASEKAAKLVELPWSIRGVAFAHAVGVAAAAKDAAVMQAGEAATRSQAEAQALAVDVKAALQAEEDAVSSQAEVKASTKKLAVEAQTALLAENASVCSQAEADALSKALAAEVEAALLAEHAAVRSQAQADTFSKALAAEAKAALQAEEAASEKDTSAFPAAAHLDQKSSTQVCKLCGAKLSAYTFSLTTAVKHRCKSCGHVFCAACLSIKAPVSGYETPKRVCSPCIEIHDLKMAGLKTARIDAEKHNAVAQEAARLNGTKVTKLKTTTTDVKERSSTAQEAAKAAAAKVETLKAAAADASKRSAAAKLALQRTEAEMATAKAAVSEVQKRSNAAHAAAQHSDAKIAELQSIAADATKYSSAAQEAAQLKFCISA